jgi:shikimate 5-dehydrogenase
VATADLVVNATSVGMSGAEEMPCPPDLLRPGQVVVDLIYGSEPTRWVTALRTSGVDAHDGLSMLVHQAAVAFSRWTGETAPVEAMRTAVRPA